MATSTTEAVQDEFCNGSTGVRLCYRTYGSTTGEPLLLIAGLGLQLISWPASLIDGLVQRGFRVITFDNRDVGRSSRIDQPPPSVLRQFLRRPAAADYDLADMASDALGLLDHLGVQRAHLAGMSMGGMIAQIIAARHPQRALSLTSIFSTTGALNVGQPAMSSMMLLLKPPAKTREASVQHFCKIMAHIGPQTYAVAASEFSTYAAGAWDRGQQAKDPEGMARQIGAIIKSGNRTAEVQRIRTPTLVVHGDLDRMVAHSGGVATAAAIANAEMITIRGMGHCISTGVSPLLVSLIDGHARRHWASQGIEQGPVRRIA